MRAAPAKPGRDRLMLGVGVPFVALLVKAVARTLRVSWERRNSYAKAVESGRPLIYAFWHGDIFNIAMGKLRLEPPGKLAVMISRSRDGERIARVAERLGLHAVRASTSKGAVSGFLELRHWLSATPAPSPNCVALAMDGPRGPRRVAKPGVALLARATGAVVLPVHFRVAPETVVKSWDRLRVPCPFARFTVCFEGPIDARGWEEDGDGANLRLITSSLPAASDP